MGGQPGEKRLRNHFCARSTATTISTQLNGATLSFSIMSPSPSHPNSTLHHLDPEQRKRLLRRKLISLVGSVCVALSAGSNYAFSSFAPQLQESLHLTSTQINLIGIAGNAGVYLSSPLWGRFIDKRGPQTALIVAAVLVPIGYAGLSLSYTGDWSLHSTPLLFGLNLLTGLGNSGGFTAAMNAQAKSWGGSRRGTATALVLSGFGLSAFFYSSLSHLLFPGNTGDYLLLLAFGSMTSMLIGLGLIKIIPPIEAADGREPAHAPRGGHAASNLIRRRTSSDIGARATIWQQPEALSVEATDDEDETNDRLRPSSAAAEGSRTAAGLSDDEEDHHIDPESQGLLSRRDESKRTGRTDIDPSQIDVSGRRLFQEIDFYLIFLVMTLVSGAGLLLINNVGTITKTLWDHNHRGNRVLVAADNADLLFRRADFQQLKLDAKASVQHLQAQQVSAISLCNFGGRILIGLLSDYLVNRTASAANRVWLLIVVTVLALASQLLAAFPGAISTVDALFAVSTLTGLAYGTLFGVCPTLVFEWFGMKHFSQNYGFVSLSPVVAGNVFNLLFGRVYDSHVPLDARMLEQVVAVLKGKAGGHGDHAPTRHLCMDGEECYRSVFVVTSVGCGVAVVVSLVLILRRARDVPSFVR